jgi:hypothetical protein
MKSFTIGVVVGLGVPYLALIYLGNVKEASHMDPWYRVE